jgi:hypothetical protein
MNYAMRFSFIKSKPRPVSNVQTRQREIFLPFFSQELLEINCFKCIKALHNVRVVLYGCETPSRILKEYYEISVCIVRGHVARMGGGEECVQHFGWEA